MPRIIDVYPQHVTAIRNEYLGLYTPTETGGQFQLYPPLEQIRWLAPLIKDMSKQAPMLSKEILEASRGIGITANVYHERFSVISGAVLALEAVKWSSITDYSRFVRHTRPQAFQHDPQAADNDLAIDLSDYKPTTVEERFANYYGPGAVTTHREEGTTGAFEVFTNSSKGPMMWGFAWLMTCVAKNEAYTMGTETTVEAHRRLNH